MLDLVEAGRPVAEIADQLGVTGQTIYNWRNQDLLDRGLRPGVSTAESVELAAARRRIRELETELAVTKRGPLSCSRSRPTQSSRLLGLRVHRPVGGISAHVFSGAA